jgi:acetyltransferase-like isoleucine patch superfamily enzyme
MIIANIQLGKNVQIEIDSNINNIIIGDNTKIANRVKIFGSETQSLEIGKNSYVGLNCFIEGFNSKVVIGDHVSIAPNVNVISGSGPNASPAMQKVFGNARGAITIGDHTWIGGNSTIMPGVTLGKYCVVAANSYVSKSFPDYSIVGGTPAKLIRTLTPSEIEILHSND